MAIVTKTFTTPCLGDLRDAINANGSISPECYQILYDGGSTTDFEFASALSGGEDTALNSLLSGWTCPVTSEETELATVQARRTTTYDNIPLTWTDLTFDTTDIENDDSIVEHTISDRITVKQDGLYQIHYAMTCDDEVQCRVRVNDTSVLAGSERQAGDPNDVNDVIVVNTATFYVELTSNDFLTVQIQASSDAENLQVGSVFAVMKVDAIQGPKGDTGTGGSIDVQKDDSSINAFTDTLNFEGSGVVSVVDEGSGKTTVTITGGTGDVTSASNISDNAIIRGDGGSKGVQQSSWTISDTGTVSGAGNINTTAGQYQIAGTPIIIKKYDFFAGQVDFPRGSNWNVNKGAPASASSTNSALTVRLFDDSVAEAIGFMVSVPNQAKEMIVRTKARAQTAPGSSQNVLMILHKRSIGDNAAVSSWSTNSLTTIAIPTNTRYQYDTTSNTLAGWGLTAGVTYQMQLSRNATNAGDTLVGDLALLVVEVEFR